MKYFHPVVPADRDAAAAMKAAVASFKGAIPGPQARPSYDEMMRHAPAAEGVTYQEDRVGGVAGWWCRPAGNTARASAGVFLHGGAYVVGSAAAYRPFVSQFVARTGVDFFVPDYRLSPEHPFPAAVEDAQAVYRGLVELGRQRIVLCGDSAGGGLALATLGWAMRTAARESGFPVPRGAAVLSPWTDLAVESASWHTRAEAEFFFTREALAAAAQSYLAGHDARDPLASPVYGELAGLPPVQMHVGDAEGLLDDAVRYAASSGAEGTAVELHVWEGMPHVFVSHVDQFEAARQAMNMAGAFLSDHLR